MPRYGGSLAGWIVVAALVGCANDAGSGEADLSSAESALVSEGLVVRGIGWRMPGFGPEHRNRTPKIGPSHGRINWTADLGGRAATSAVVAQDGSTFVVTRRGRLSRVSSDGTIHWTRSFGRADAAPSITVEDTVLLGTRRGDLVHVDTAGNVVWRADVGRVTGAPVIHGRSIFVPTDEGLVALHSDGSRLWEHRATAFKLRSPAVTEDGRVYLVEHQEVVALSHSGTELWRTRVAHPITSLPTVDDQGNVLVAGRSLTSLARDGSVRWSTPLEGVSASHIAIGRPSGGSPPPILVTSSDVLRALRDDGDSVTELWRLDANSELFNPVVDGDGRVFVVEAHSVLRSVDSQTGMELWRESLEATPTGGMAMGSAGELLVPASRSLLSVGRNDLPVFSVSDPSPCVGESFSVEAIDGDGADVRIAQLPTTTLWTQFAGTAGPRRLMVQAELDGRVSTATLEISTEDCGRTFPFIRLSPVLSEPYGVDLVVTTADDLGPGRYHWEFGDGESMTTVLPTVRHSYINAANRTDELLVFDVSVTFEPAVGGATVASRRTVGVSNDYARLLSRGAVQPIVDTAEHELRQAASDYEGSFEVTHLEESSIRTTTRTRVYHPCDPDREPRSDSEPFVLDLPPGTTSVDVAVPTSDLPSNVCGYSEVYEGEHLGLPVFLRADFDTPHPTFFRGPVTDAQTVGILNDAAARGLIGDTVTGDELRQLHYAGLIPEPPIGAHVTAGALHHGPTTGGHPCLPGDVPHRPGFTCQATDEFTVSPPLVRNALKGDILLVTACGPLRELVQNVNPPQQFTHEGIMTRNYYAVSHSTMVVGPLTDNVNTAIGANIGTIEEHALRFAFPGTKHLSVDEAFNGVIYIARDGTPYRDTGFRKEPVICPDPEEDLMAITPRVLRPPPAGAAAARPTLHAAADLAASAGPSHYRFFGFTDGTSVQDSDFVSPTGEPATISTLFIWDALDRAGAFFEGDTLEAGDRDSEAVIDPSDVGFAGDRVDGLYFYDEAERTAALERLHGFVFNLSRSTLGERCDIFDDICEELTDASSKVANQVANCFAFDACSELAARFAFWASPGPGRTVSPDDFLLWDAPDTGGVYGHEERLSYRDSEFTRVYRWAASEGAGSVAGVTLLDGAPASDPDIRVLIAVGCPSGTTCPGVAETGVGPDGTFRLDPVPAGTYTVRAEWPHDCNDDGLVELCLTEQLVTVVDGEETFVELDFADGVGSPEEVSFETRLVTLKNIRLDVFDDDTVGSDHEVLEPDDRSCEVSALNTLDTIEPFTTCADEVRVVIEGQCRWQLDESVEVTLIAKLFEQTNCTPVDLDGVQAAEQLVLKDFTHSGMTVEVTNEDEGGGDRGFVQLDIENAAGRTGTITRTELLQHRRIRAVGDAHIVDHECFLCPNETADTTFVMDCNVSPGALFDEDLWAECVGDEVQLVQRLTCTFDASTGEIHTTHTAELFEWSGCTTDPHQRTGRTMSLDTTFPPCDTRCFESGTTDFPVGGSNDRAAITFNYINTSVF